MFPRRFNAFKFKHSCTMLSDHSGFYLHSEKCAIQILHFFCALQPERRQTRGVEHGLMRELLVGQRRLDRTRTCQQLRIVVAVKYKLNIQILLFIKRLMHAAILCD